jgi:ribonuclease J
MASVTCFGGVREIGGNKFLVEDKGTRIFLDFGQSFSHLDQYFAEYLQPRTRFGLRDLFALGLMPKLKGLYGRWAVEKTDLEHCDPEYHGVFISHPHFDHIAHLRYLDHRIPIYLGETARTILSSLNDTGRGQVFCEKDTKAFDGSVIHANDLRNFRTGSRLKVDDIEVVPVHVDHSVPGAYGFIVHTSEGAIAYTGDIRRHGIRPEMTQDFIDAARESKPKMLICEGTRVAPEDTREELSEPEVYSRTKKIAEGDGLVLAMRYPKDLDRLRTFYEAAKETGRILVIGLKTAYLLDRLKDDRINLPEPFNDENIRVYKREMKIYKDWERPLLEKCVDSAWVNENQGKIIWELDFFQLTELVDVKPSKGTCIHSMSEPFEDDPMSQVQDEVLNNWLKRFGIGHVQLHASGHSSMDEIFEIAKSIGPQKIIPVHTQHPELFSKTGIQVVFPEREKAIFL